MPIAISFVTTLIVRQVLFMLSFLVMLAPGAGAAESCEALVAHRDGDLLKAWDVAAAKYRYNSEAKADMSELRKEIMDDTKWKISTTGEATYGLFLTIRATVDLIGDLLGFVPGTGQILSGTRNAARQFTAKMVKQRLDEGRFFYDITQEGVLATTTKMVLSEINPVTHATVTVWNLSENLADIAAYPGDIKQLRKDVTAAVDRLDKALIRFDEQIAKSSERMEYVNAIKNGIDAKCGHQKETASNKNATNETMSKECQAKQIQLLAMTSCKDNPESCDASEAIAIHDWMRDHNCTGVYSQDSSFQGGSAVGVGKQSPACIDLTNEAMAAGNRGDIDAINRLTPQLKAACK